MPTQMFHLQRLASAAEQHGADPLSVPLDRPFRPLVGRLRRQVREVIPARVDQEVFRRCLADVRNGIPDIEFVFRQFTDNCGLHIDDDIRTLAEYH